MKQQHALTNKRSMGLRYLSLILLSIALTACGDKPRLPRLSDNAVILAYGDSLTYGTGAARSESYPAVLQRLSGHRVINAGIHGEITRTGLERLPAQLHKYHPGLLILCHGGNDFLQKRDPVQVANNILRMVELARRRNIPVILLGVPKPGLFLRSADMYKEIADATGALLIDDLIPDVLGDASLKSDPVHPNRDGYRIMAEEILAVLKQNGAL